MFQAPQLAMSPKGTSRLKRHDILNEVANFRADKIQNINFARPLASKDSSPLKTGKRSPYHAKQLSRLATSKDEKPSARGRVGASLELDYDYGSQPLYASGSRPYQRSRSELHKDDADDFGYDEPATPLGNREAAHGGPEDLHVSKASKNRYNLRKMPGHQRSLLLDK
jgi:hypothetical protein